MPGCVPDRAEGPGALVTSDPNPVPHRNTGLVRQRTSLTVGHEPALAVEAPMRRKTFDTIASVTGLVMALVLAVAGGPNRSAVHFKQIFDNRQTQPQPF